MGRRKLNPNDPSVPVDAGRLSLLLNVAGLSFGAVVRALGKAGIKYTKAALVDVSEGRAKSAPHSVRLGIARVAVTTKSEAERVSRWLGGEEQFAAGVRTLHFDRLTKVVRKRFGKLDAGVVSCLDHLSRPETWAGLTGRIIGSSTEQEAWFAHHSLMAMEIFIDLIPADAPANDLFARLEGFLRVLGEMPGESRDITLRAKASMPDLKSLFQNTAPPILQEIVRHNGTKPGKGKPAKRKQPQPRRRGAGGG